MEVRFQGSVNSSMLASVSLKATIFAVAAVGVQLEKYRCNNPDLFIYLILSARGGLGSEIEYLSIYVFISVLSPVNNSCLAFYISTVAHNE